LTIKKTESIYVYYNR